MKPEKTNQPPHYAMAFFYWFCRAEFREEIEGDLRERFEVRSFRCGRKRNNLLFLLDVLSLFRPPLLGNFHQLTFNNFTSLRQVLGRLPEAYLVFLICLFKYEPPFSKGTLTIWLTAILLLPVILKSRVLWRFVAVLFILLNFCLVPPFISEFSEFPEFAEGAQQMLFCGLVLLLLNISACGALIAKYTDLNVKIVSKFLLFLTGIWFALISLVWSQRFPGHATSAILFYLGLVVLALTVITSTVMLLNRNTRKLYSNRRSLSPLSRTGTDYTSTELLK